jgi:hypothetical protein
MQHRLSYAVGRLEGVVFEQILPYIEDNAVNLDDIDALIKFLEDAFGDPDRVATATRELGNLRQANREFSLYFADFQRLSAETEWNESAKKDALQNGLCEELKDALTLLSLKKRNTRLSLNNFSDWITSFGHARPIRRRAERTLVRVVRLRLVLQHQSPRHPQLPEDIPHRPDLVTTDQRLWIFLKANTSRRRRKPPGRLRDVASIAAALAILQEIARIDPRKCTVQWPRCMRIVVILTKKRQATASSSRDKFKLWL